MSVHRQRGEERTLFNALCGAGHGLGIVTSVIMKAFSIRNLRMTDDSIWSRSIVFPPAAMETAAEAFVGFSDPAPPLSIVLLCTRAPATAPVPGAPMLILTASMPWTISGSRESGRYPV